MLRLSAFLILSVASSAFADPVSALAKARHHFERAEDKVALKILQEVVKRYPGQRPAFMLMGRIHYRHGRYRLAFASFKRADPTALDIHATYEYGMSAFMTQKYREAMNSLRRIGRESAYHHLAQFYAGVAAMNMRDYIRAEESLLQAVDLPQSFLRVKEQYLNEIRRVRFRSPGNLTTRPQAFYQTPLPMAMIENQEKPDYLLQSGTPGKKEAQSATRLPRGLLWSVTPSLLFSSQFINEQKHGFDTTNIQVENLTLGLSPRIEYFLKPFSSGSQAKIALAARYGLRHIQRKGESILVQQGEYGEFMGRKSTEGYTRSFDLEHYPHVVVPVFNHFELSLGGLHREIWPDANYELASTFLGAKGSANVKWHWLAAGGSATLLQGSRYDVENEKVLSSQENQFDANVSAQINTFSTLSLSYSHMDVDDPKLGLSSPLLARFMAVDQYGLQYQLKVKKLGLGFEFNQLIYTPETIPGPVGPYDITTIKVVPSFSFDLGLNLSAYAGMESTSEFRVLGLCPESSDGIVESKCTSTARDFKLKKEASLFGMTASLHLVDWLTPSMSYMMSEATFTGVDDKYKRDFQRQHVDFFDNFNISIQLVKNF
jgi:hypothetical protein